MTEEIKQRSSFKLVKNAKGGLQFEIKVYGDTIEEIQEDTEKMFKWVEEKYGGEK